MTTIYSIKKAADLLPHEIQIILEHWEVEEWIQLSSAEFREKFNQSEFHLLTDESAAILCLARINFDFKIRVQNEVHEFAELVGLVATVKMKGYGKKLINQLRDNLKDRKIETVGFCEKPLRPFYEKCQVAILYDKAKQLRESQLNEWTVPTDDDILNISLSEYSIRLLNGLNPDNLGYLVFS